LSCSIDLPERRLAMKTDHQLRRDVEEELGWEPSVHAEHIGVSAQDGVVELSGHVESYYEKWAAERAALRVDGVSGIASEIKVELPSPDMATDEDIAHAAVDHLTWNSSVPRTIKVRVADGWVTLYGTAEWQYQKIEAQEAVRPLLGVKGVTNEIELKPRIFAGDVRAKIEEALKRSAQIDAGHITVATSDGTVILRGNVRSWAERQEAEEAAFAAPGVTRVENHINIVLDMS
jgi:osmotically-inducible protein OsmY